MITIEQVIDFFEQEQYTGSINTKEAAAVIRAQHEEIDRLRAWIERNYIYSPEAKP